MLFSGTNLFVTRTFPTQHSWSSFRGRAPFICCCTPTICKHAQFQASLNRYCGPRQGAVRQIRTNLSQASGVVLYAATSSRHSVRAVDRVSLKVSRLISNRGAARRVRTRLSKGSIAALYPAQRPPHSAKAVARLVLKRRRLERLRSELKSLHIEAWMKAVSANFASAYIATSPVLVVEMESVSFQPGC